LHFTRKCSIYWSSEYCHYFCCFNLEAISCIKSGSSSSLSLSFLVSGGYSGSTLEIPASGGCSGKHSSSCIFGSHNHYRLALLCPNRMNGDYPLNLIITSWLRSILNHGRFLAEQVGVIPIVVNAPGMMSTQIGVPTQTCLNTYLRFLHVFVDWSRGQSVKLKWWGSMGDHHSCNLDRAMIATLLINPHKQLSS